MFVNSIISLQIDERHFVIFKSILEKKFSFFKALLIEEWQDSRSLDDSYFVDANSDFFVHILRYFRRGVFFLFYKAIYEFDFDFYQTLQKKTLYFEIEDLHIWIKDQKYAQIVKIQYTVNEVKGDEISVMNHFTTLDDTSDRLYHSVWGTEKIYQCFRNIFVSLAVG